MRASSRPEALLHQSPAHALPPAMQRGWGHSPKLSCGARRKGRGRRRKEKKRKEKKRKERMSTRQIINMYATAGFRARLTPRLRSRLLPEEPGPGSPKPSAFQHCSCATTQHKQHTLSLFRTIAVAGAATAADRRVPTLTGSLLTL